jgi:hypothetical protein
LLKLYSVHLKASSTLFGKDNYFITREEEPRIAGQQHPCFYWVRYHFQLHFLDALASGW